MADYDYRNDVSEFNRAVGAWRGTAIKWALGLVALMLAASVLGFGWRWVTAEPKGRLEAREQILSGANRIAQYNHFFNLCASIQANEAQLDALLAEKATASPTRIDTVNASITGVSAARLGAIAQYNANAAKDYTSGQFLASNLPYQIPATPYTGGRTKCAS